MRAALAVLSALLAASTVTTDAAPRLRRIVESVVLADYAGDWYTVPTAINNRGEIVGYASGPEGESVAFLRTSRGRYHDIVDGAIPQDVNDRGEVVGMRFPCSGDECWIEGFSWRRGEGLENLGSFLPFAVNDRGDMAGVCNTEWQACVLRDGVVSPVAEPGSVAHGINRRGDVVGIYGDNRAFHVTPDWQFHDIGRAVANDINDHRTIAGHRWTLFGERGERGRVTAWTRKGTRSPAREVSIGEAINDKGWIIANAWDEQERAYSFAWDPATNVRVRLSSTTGEWVILADINDRGDVVGTAGTHAAIWRVRERLLKREDRN